MTCPGCNRQIENMYLLRLHVAFPGAIVSPDGLDQAEMGEIWVTDLKVRIEEEAKNVADRIQYFGDVWLALISASFSFPCKVTSASIYSIFENPIGTIWLHCWVYRDDHLHETDSDVPTGLVSFKVEDCDGFRVASTTVSDVLASHVE